MELGVVLLKVVLEFGREKKGSLGVKLFNLCMCNYTQHIKLVIGLKWIDNASQA